MAIVITKTSEVYTLDIGGEPTKVRRFSSGGFTMETPTKLRIHDGAGRTIHTDDTVDAGSYDIAGTPASDAEDLAAKLYALGLTL